MYKDKAKQREANRLQMQRARAAKGNTKQPVSQSNTSYPRVTDQDFTKLMAQAGPGHVRVSKPGDADYEPQCETTRAFVEDRPRRKRLCFGIRTEEGKRGKDIKVFADLPPDVQQTIDIMSVVEGKIDQIIKANRTAIAVHYQHLFPDRYNSTGVVI